MSTETFIVVEFVGFFGMVLAFCIQQLWSLKKLERKRLAEAEKAAQPSP